VKKLTLRAPKQRWRTIETDEICVFAQVCVCDDPTAIEGFGFLTLSFQKITGKNVERINKQFNCMVGLFRRSNYYGVKQELVAHCTSSKLTSLGGICG
jgi:hypothetical protein